MNDLDELIQLVPPPIRPMANHGDWDKIQTELGLLLPNDYKAFIATYGSGRFCDYFYIVSPFELIDPPRQFWTNWAAFYSAMAEQGELIPYPYYPGVPGLLPCGNYGDVNILNWFTTGNTDSWDFIFYDRMDGFYNLGRIGLVSFLHSVLKGTCALPPNIIGSEVRLKPFSFIPG